MSSSFFVSAWNSIFDEAPVTASVGAAFSAGVSAAASLAASVESRRCSRPVTASGCLVSARLPASSDCRAAINERTKLIFLCTPNNPTGNRIEERELRRILGLGLPTVIDEAYVELAGRGASYHYLVAEYPNALVLRTFSTGYGLAGVRVGYALGHPAHIRLLSRVKVPWNLSAVAIAAACAVLDDEREQRRRVETLREGRAYLEREVARLPGVEILRSSEANFVTVDISGTGLTADAMVESMLAKGFFIRSLQSHRADRHLVRITVGATSENRRCVRALREVLVSSGADVAVL